MAYVGVELQRNPRTRIRTRAKSEHGLEIGARTYNSVLSSSSIPSRLDQALKQRLKKVGQRVKLYGERIRGRSLSN